MSNRNPSPVVEETRQRRSGWHRSDLLSLFFGIVFLAVVGWWAASYSFDWGIDWNLPNLGWFVAGALILLGLLGLLASLRRSPDRAPDLPPPPAAAGPAPAPAPASTIPPGEAPTEVPLTVRTFDPEPPMAAEPDADRPE